MALIWSRPNVAAGTRYAYETVTRKARIDVTRVQSPSVNSASTSHRGRVGRPHPPVGDQPPERVGVVAVREAPHQAFAQPAAWPKNSGSASPQTAWVYSSIRPGQDPDEPQQGRVGRREPERVPRLPSGPRGILRVGNRGDCATVSWEDPQFTLFVALGIVQPSAVADALHRRKVMSLLDQGDAASRVARGRCAVHRTRAIAARNPRARRSCARSA